MSIILVTIPMVNGGFVLPSVGDEGNDICGFCAEEEIFPGMTEGKVYVIGDDDTLSTIVGKNKRDVTAHVERLHLKQAHEKAEKKKKDKEDKDKKVKK
jgi:hypothetical protein